MSKGLLQLIAIVVLCPPTFFMIAGLGIRAALLLGDHIRKGKDPMESFRPLRVVVFWIVYPTLSIWSLALAAAATFFLGAWVVTR